MGFSLAVTLQVRALDNVLDVTLWPLPQQQKEALAKRRIGIGFTGLGNALAMLGKAYDSEEGRCAAAEIARVMRDTAYLASVHLALERGSFSLFNADEFLKEGRFASRLPDDIKELIRTHGIRNSHLLSIAPTGTVSLAFADNASNGIEPPFSLSYQRKKRNGDGSTTTYDVLDHGLRVYLQYLADNQANGADLGAGLLRAITLGKETFELNGETFLVKGCLPKAMVTALEMSTDGHLLMMKAVQPFIDSSISKTVNVPAECTFDDFKQVYDKAHCFGLKGVATYRPNAILGSVLSVASAAKKEEPAAIAPPVGDIDPLSTVIERRPNEELDAVVKKVPYSGPNGDSALFVTISFINVTGVYQGQEYTVARPIEIFIQAATNGAPSEWVAAHARDLSLHARSGLPILAKALQNSREIVSDKGRTRYGWFEKADGTKTPRFHGSDVACIAYALQEILIRKGLLSANGDAFNLKRLVAAGVTSQSNPLLVPAPEPEIAHAPSSAPTGKPCPDCGALTLVKCDGCEKCTSCGYLGSCG